MIIMRDDDDNNGSNGSDDDPFNYSSSSSPHYHHHTLFYCCLVLKNAQFVNTVVDVHLNHFTCPLCKKIGNTIMPYTSHATSPAVATTAVGDGDEDYQSKQCSDELSSSADDSEWLMMMMAADTTTTTDDDAGIGRTDSDGVIMMAEWNR